MIKPRIVSTCCDVLKCPRRGSVCSSRWTLRNGAKHDETIGEFNIKTNEIIIHIGDHNVMMVALLCCRLQLRIHLYINRIEYLSLSTGQTRQRVWCVTECLVSLRTNNHFQAGTKRPIIQLESNWIHWWSLLSSTSDHKQSIKSSCPTGIRSKAINRILIRSRWCQEDRS